MNAARFEMHDPASNPPRLRIRTRDALPGSTGAANPSTESVSAHLHTASVCARRISEVDRAASHTRIDLPGETPVCDERSARSRIGGCQFGTVVTNLMRPGLIGSSQAPGLGQLAACPKGMLAMQWSYVLHAERPRGVFENPFARTYPYATDDLFSQHRCGDVSAISGIVSLSYPPECRVRAI